MNRDDRAPYGLLWVDAVGGYLTYLADQIAIGQAIPGTDVDLPILGDLSRRHAVVERAGEDYVIRPLGPVQLSGHELAGPSRLADGVEIGLGERVVLRFRRPSAWSNSARLEIISHHRTQPPCDGILMLGETCLLGPAEDNHVVCRHWREQVILMPTDDGRFRFKAEKSVIVDDVPSCDTGIIDWGSRLTGDDFAFMLERL